MKYLGILLPALLAFALPTPMVPERPGKGGVEAQDEGSAPDLTAQLAAAGVRVDLAAGLASVPANVLVRQDLLEYLLVSERGAAHESMFLTSVQPSVLNIALLALGVEKGTNARFEPVDPPPTDDELRAGAPSANIIPPHGDGFLLYAAWREGDETYLYRIDDLITNLHTGRSMRRHRWVYLGSRFAKVRPQDEEEQFVADLEGNLINISFFYQGNTILTGSLPQCEGQTNWVANNWLLPAFEAPVSLIFARERIDRLPDEWVASLPVVMPPVDDAADER